MPSCSLFGRETCDAGTPFSDYCTGDPVAAFAGRVSGERAPFAASAPVLLELTKQMREVRAASDGPGLRAVLDGILDERAPLSTLLSAGVLLLLPR